eukprot:Em0021g358a
MSTLSQGHHFSAASWAWPDLSNCKVFERLNGHSSESQNRVPSPPCNFTLSATPGSPAQLSASWCASNISNGTIKAYSVFCNTSANQSNSEQVIGSNAPTVRSVVNGTTLATTLTGLNPYTQYSCYVTANTSVGQGSPSVVVTRQTAQSVPSSPQNFTLLPISSTQLSASWSVPIPRNGIITGYSVYCNTSANQAYPEQVIGSNVPTIRSAVNGTTLATTLTGLNPYTQYSCYVTANTSVGQGSPSVVVTRQTAQSVPSSPQNFTLLPISSTQLSASWSVPIPRNGIITGYSVYCNTSANQAYPEQMIGSNMPTVRSAVNGTTLATTLTGLNPYTQYSCYVTANISVGEGGSSAVFSAQTAETAPPPPPLNVTAYNTSSTTIMVTWQRPQYPNGIIRGYQMSYTPQGGNASLLNISSANSSILLTGLQIYKVYNVSLRVLTAAYSNFSSVFSVSTDEGASSAPLNVTVYNITSMTLFARWQPPLQTNGILRGYTVSYMAQGDSTSLTTFATNANVSLTALKPYTVYIITVMARTKVDGTPSNQANISTAQDVPGPAQSLGVLQKTFTTITLMWLPPLMPNGVITQYQLTWGSSLPTYVTAPFAVVSGLNVSSTYTFNVTAWTVVGAGKPTAVQASTALIPNVTGVSVMPLNATTVQVSWMRIDIPSDGTIVGYNVLYTLYNTKNKKRQSSGLAQFIQGDVTQGVIGDLKPLQLYQFSVAAVISVAGEIYSGMSPPSGPNSPIYNPASTTSSAGNWLSTAVFAGSLSAEFVVVLLVMVLVVLIVLLVMRRRLKQNYVLRICDGSGKNGAERGDIALHANSFSDGTVTMAERNSSVTEKTERRYAHSLRTGSSHKVSTTSSPSNNAMALKEVPEVDEWPEPEETYQVCDFTPPGATEACESSSQGGDVVATSQAGPSDYAESIANEDTYYESNEETHNGDVKYEGSHEPSQPDFSLYDVVENEGIYDSVN